MIAHGPLRVRPGWPGREAVVDYRRSLGATAPLAITAMQKDFSRLEAAVGHVFSDKDVLTQAFVHRSYLNEHPSFATGHNERLEFLGDAVLELVVTEHLYRGYPNPEGELT